MSTKHSSKPTVVQTYLCAVIFALLVSLVSQTNKLASVYRLPFLVLFFRYLFSFSGNFLMQRLGVLHCSYRGKGQRLLLLVNAIVYTSAHALQIWGLLFAPSILFAILFATVPVWVEILAFFILKERPGLPATLLVLVSLAALVIMILLGQNEKMGAISPLGFALLLMSCILEAGNNTLVRFLRKEYSPVEISFSASGIAFTLCLVYLAFSCARTPGLFGQMAHTACQSGFILPVLYLGLGGTFAASIFKGIILQNMSALKASAWSNVASALSILFGVILLKERLYGYQVICSAVIIGSVLGIQVSKS